MSSTYSQLSSLCKQELINIYKHAIDAVRPERLIKNALNIQDGILITKNPSIDNDDVRFDLKETNLHVIGGGKSVLSMARGLAEIAAQHQITNLFSHGSLSVPIGLRPEYEPDLKAQNLLKSINVECHFGSCNNLPDKDSVLVSRNILKQITWACEKDRIDKRRSLFIVLISGGGSACLTNPRYIDLSEKLALIKFLVQKGADIVELNKVRSFFSDIKGGKLASHILKSNPNSQILSLILSDVIGDPIEYIASGPTVLNHKDNELNSMMEVLRKYNFDAFDIRSKLPKIDNIEPLHTWSSVYNRVIGSNQIALEAVTEYAESLGYKVVSLGKSVNGPTEDCIEKILSYKDRYVQDANRKLLIICGGEATVEKHEGETWGKGGRAQEMALDYIIRRLTTENEEANSQIDYFLAGGTDGQDGPTDVAGCLASYYEWLGQSRRPFGLNDAMKAKKSHSSYDFWNEKKPDWLIKTGLTGTNVMDLYLYMNIRMNDESC